MGIELNKAQKHVVKEAVKWYNHSDSGLFQFTGEAGTGKSVVLRSIVDELGLAQEEVAPMAYIGAAAIVMRRKGFPNAKTIHSWIYNFSKYPEKDENGNVVYDEYYNRPKMKFMMRPKYLRGIKLIIIDEAGTVPAKLAREIESRHIKVIATGDLNQLPPPFSSPYFLTSGTMYRLDEVMRQAEESPIIFLAHRAIQGKNLELGTYGNTMVINKDDLTEDMLKNAEIVLAGYNNTRDRLNRYYREMKGIDPSDILPKYGEPLICRKNHWAKEVDGISLANGLIGDVLSHPDVSGVRKGTFSVDFLPRMGNKAFLDLKVDLDYFKASTEQKKSMNSMYGSGERFEFAYSITTHISQGSQFNNGIYVEEAFPMKVQRQLNYTGITRFSDSMIYVKRSKKYY